MKTELAAQALPVAPAPRMDFPAFARQAPAAYAALTAFGQAVADSGLDPGLTELAKLRASQLNGCAFCLQYHLNLARRAGLTGPKLDLLAAWREAGVYSARERAALAWAEVVTAHPAEAALDAPFAVLAAALSPAECLYLTLAVSSINQWNRIAVALRFTPPLPTQVPEAA